MEEKGGISVRTEHIFPIIKRWLYSDKDIFLREIVSNASDAITKLRHLCAIGEAQGIDESDYRITVTADENAKTVSVEDNGIGMTADEVRNYINNIALSGALEFVKKYEGSNAENDGIIGHFGLGFYSAFMVADKVTIETKSYNGEDAVKWTGSEDGSFVMEDCDRDGRGTKVTMYLTDEDAEFGKKGKLTEILEKYCAFMPFPICLSIVGEEPQKDKDGNVVEPKPLNDTQPLWQKQPSECTEEEYSEFYKKVFNDYRDPIFHIHLNADYPLNFKGILYFPRMTSAYEGVEGQIKLFYNRVFVADNIKEIIPDYLLMLKGVLDCPEMPLNVSRSYLQNNAYVSKVSAHIVKKVCDKLVSIHDTDLEKYKTEWDELKTFVKYASMRDKKVYDRLKDIVLMETVDGDYVSLKEYLETAREKDGKKIAYYATDKKQQAVYINMFKNEGITVVVLADFIDNNYMSIVEQSEQNVKFLRIDAEADALKTDAESSENEKLKELFAKISGNETMKITFMPLKDTKIPALLNIDEESRRFSEMMKMYAAANKKMQEDLPQQATLVLNTENALIKKLGANCENGASDVDEAIARQIYTLALIGQRQLSASELEAFLDNSYGLLEKL